MDQSEPVLVVDVSLVSALSAVLVADVSLVSALSAVLVADVSAVSETPVSAPTPSPFPLHPARMSQHTHAAVRRALIVHPPVRCPERSCNRASQVGVATPTAGYRTADPVRTQPES